MNTIKRDTSQKHQSIVTAAMKAFSELGYENTSMDLIAEKASASKRTVYNHFPSKDLLFQAVLEQFVLAMQDLKQIDYDPARTLEEQLAEFADAELALTNNPAWMGFMKVILTLFIRNPEMARQAMSRHLCTQDALATWLQAAVDDSRLKVDNPQLAARVFWAMFSGAFTWPAIYQGWLDPETVPAIKQELIETFLCRYRK